MQPEVRILWFFIFKQTLRKAITMKDGAIYWIGFSAVIVMVVYLSQVFC